MKCYVAQFNFECWCLLKRNTKYVGANHDKFLMYIKKPEAEGRVEEW